MSVYQEIEKACKKDKKLLAVLIDPDKIQSEKLLKQFIDSCEKARVDIYLLGGSLLINPNSDKLTGLLKSLTKKPVILFPGDPLQIRLRADAILFLSLISGRNPELLIGHHVTAAPYLKKSGIEVISTGYMLIDCGNITTAAYMSQSLPIPYIKNEIAAVTALAGNLLGMKLIYADGGSGALKTISPQMIQSIKKQITIPLFVGGGIKNLKDAEAAWKAGADVVVIGTAFEKNPSLISTFAKRK